MRALRAWLIRLAALFSTRRELELAEEMDSHLALHIDDNRRAGMSPAEARRQAVLALGGLDQTKERVRERAGLPQIEALLYDIRHAVRALARRKVFVLTATLSIAFGVGLNLAVYTLLRGVLFSGWVSGAPAPERLVTILPGLSYPNYRDLQGYDLPVEIAALQSSTLIWRTESETTTLAGRVVSQNFFDVLRLRPMLGQIFLGTPAGIADRAIVSFEFWQRRLRGDPAAIGQTLDLNGWPHLIVGVLPPGFTTQVGPLISPSVYVPISPHVANGLENRAAAQFDLLGRLRDGATMPQAAASLRVALQTLEREFPDQNSGIVQSLRLEDGSVGPFRAMLTGARPGRIVLSLVGAGYALISLVLVVACANVAGLLTARAEQRRHETAVRIALGAGRARLVQQSLVESVLIAALGCGMATAVWAATIRLLPTSSFIVNAGIELVPARLPLALAGMLLAIVSLACGVAPALAAARVSPIGALKAGRLGDMLRRFRLQSGLVAAQVLVSVILLSVAFLLTHAYALQVDVTPGFDTLHTASISARVPSTPGGPTLADVKAALERTPGVESVSYGALPLGILLRSATVRRLAGTDPIGIDLQPVGPGYLTTMGIPITAGRDLREDDLPPAGGDAGVVVNETFARRYFATDEPLNQRIVLERDRENGRPDRTLRVVGVARDTKVGRLNDDNLSVVYLPTRAALSIVVRVSGPAVGAVPGLSNVAAGALPGAALSVTPMSSQLRLALLPSRIGAVVLLALGVIGLVMAMTGLIGIISAETTRRTFEIGVRMALGATKPAVIWLVLRNSVRIVLLSAIAGMAVAVAIGRALTPLLAAGQRAGDPVALVLVVLVLVVAGAAAALGPARRASGVDPAVALRSEA